MLHTRLLVESDIPAAVRLSTQAGWNQLEADWRRLLALWPEQCLAGRVDGQLVATGTLASYGDIGWIGMILVDQACRGQGLGTRIFDDVLDLAVCRGVRTLGLDATDLGRPIYTKRGFQAVCAINRWVAACPAPRTDGDRCSSVAPEHWEQIAAMGRRAAGVDRLPLLRHLAMEDRARSRVAMEDGRAAACAFARPGRIAWHIGPVTGEPPAASRILDAMLREMCGEAAAGVLMDVPENACWESELAARGFAVARRLTRMVLGDAAAKLTGPACLAASGLELG